MKFKKVLAMVLAAAMFCSLALTGCGGSSAAPAESKQESAAPAEAASAAAEATSAAAEATSAAAEAASTAAEATADASALAGKKIGMTLLMNDGLFAIFADYVQGLCEACGAELVLDVGAFSPEDQVASIENLIAAGVDGIMYCNFGETVLPKVCQLCEDAEIPWVQYCRPVEDQDVLDTLNSSKYYVGRTIEDNKQVGINIANQFKEMGLTKTAIVGPTPGDSTTEQVAEGFKEQAAANGIEILTEVRSAEEAADCTKAAETILSNFPETEGICLLSGATGRMEGLFKGLENMGKLGEVAVGALDGSDDFEEELANGYSQILHTGQYVDPGFSLAILLNAVAGTPLSDEKIEIVDQYIVCRTPEDAVNFRDVVCNSSEHKYAYTGDEFKQFIKVFNPDATLETLQDAASAYSVDDVVARHG